MREIKYFWCKNIINSVIEPVRIVRYYDNEGRSVGYPEHSLFGSKYHTGKTKFDNKYILLTEIHDFKME